MKIAIVYWSGTGNTEAMAKEIAVGARGKGASVDLFTAADFEASKAGSYDVLAFGCPAMGAEELEEDEFAPMFEAVEPDGATASGCAPGRSRSRATAPTWLQTVSSSMRSRMRTDLRSAKHWASSLPLNIP